MCLHHGMRTIAIAGMTLLLVACAADSQAKKREAEDAIYDYAMKRNLLFVFTPAVENERWQDQTEVLGDSRIELGDRDFTVVEVVGTEADIVFPEKEKLHPDAARDLRGRFGVEPAMFAIVVLGKDTKTRLRSFEPIGIAEIVGALEKR